MYVAFESSHLSVSEWGSFTYYPCCRLHLVWDAPILAWNIGESRWLQWGEEWNKCSQDGPSWPLEVEQIPTNLKADIVLFTLMLRVADKHDSISVLLLLYENKYYEQYTQSICYLIPFKRRIYYPFLL